MWVNDNFTTGGLPLSVGSLEVENLLLLVGIVGETGACGKDMLEFQKTRAKC